MMKFGNRGCFFAFAGAARCLWAGGGREYLEGHTSMIRRDPIGSCLYRAVELYRS